VIKHEQLLFVPNYQSIQGGVQKVVIPGTPEFLLIKENPTGPLRDHTDDLSEEKFVKVLKAVVDRHPGVHRCPDHGPPIRTFKVALHNLVQFAVAQH